MAENSQPCGSTLPATVPDTDQRRVERVQMMARLLAIGAVRAARREAPPSRTADDDRETTPDLGP